MPVQSEKKTIRARQSRQHIYIYRSDSAEKIDLLRLRRLTLQLQIAQPGTIVREYFAARRRMKYRGRIVVHISRTCRDLWQVRACIPPKAQRFPNRGGQLKYRIYSAGLTYSPPFVFFYQHRILQEGSHSCVYQAFSEIIKWNLSDDPLPGMRSSAPPHVKTPHVTRHTNSYLASG
jgi:hypothetical protein